MSETRHTVDPKFTYRDKRSGKDVVLYQGLLDAAHRAGLVYIETTILQFPCAENDQTCIVKATVTLGDPDQPRVFSAIGDANPRNVGANIAPHFIRMAETRAKARALRDILNVGTVSVEELGGDEDAAPQQATPPRDWSRRSDTAPTDLRPAAAPTVAAGNPPGGEVRMRELLSTIRDDLADPKKRLRALHEYYGEAMTIAGLNNAVEQVKQSGLPSDDLSKAYRWHHDRLSKLFAPVSVAG